MSMMSTVRLTPSFTTVRDDVAAWSGQIGLRPPTLRLTRRGRAVLMIGFLAVLFVLMTAFGGLAAATRHGGTPERVRIVQVQPGDTLYGIAGRVAAPGQVRQMVDRIEELNSLGSAGLQIGQTLAVPVPGS